MEINFEKSNNHMDYNGNELEIFKFAENWKNYFSKEFIPYIKGEVLEVGAGNGVNSHYLAKRLDIIKSWCFLEPDKQLAAQIKENTSNIRIQQKSIINGIITDIKDKTFDTIIYIDVLEHIRDSTKEIEMIKKCLKPNGYLLVLVPAYNFLYNNFDKKIGHFRRYNKKLLMGEVNNQLKKERLFYLDSIGCLVSVANKLVLKIELPTLENIRYWDKYLVPLSKFFDIFSIRLFGRSLIGVFKNEN